MIQPINPAIQNCYSYGRTFKAKPKFTGYYNPTIVHVTSDMQQGATDTLGKIADKMKDAASKINETFFKEVPNAAKESMVAGGVAAGGNITVLDANNIVNEETGEYTHILPSGDTVSFTDESGIQEAGTLPTSTDDAPFISLPDDASDVINKASIRAIDGANIQVGDSFIHYAGGEIPINIGNVSDASVGVLETDVYAPDTDPVLLDTDVDVDGGDIDIDIDIDAPDEIDFPWPDDVEFPFPDVF